MTYYCYMQERDECAGKGMAIARTYRWNKTEMLGNETEVRKSVYHKLRHLNYNFKGNTSPPNTTIFTKCFMSLQLAVTCFGFFRAIFMLNLGGCIYRLSQEEWTKLRESVPYVELYRYNPKHLYPKLNGYGDNGQRSLKI